MMNIIKGNLNKFKTKRKYLNLLIICIAFFLIFIYASSFVTASDSDTTDSDTTVKNPSVRLALERVIEDENCSPIEKKQASDLLKSNPKTDVSGTFVIAKNRDQKITIVCNSPFEIEKIAIGSIALIQSLIGIVLLIGLGRTVFHMLLNAENPDEFKKGYYGIVNSIIFTVVNLMSYLIIIYVMMAMGIGTSKEGGQYNLVCQQQLVFQVFFAEPDGEFRDVCGE